MEVAIRKKSGGTSNTLGHASAIVFCGGEAPFASHLLYTQDGILRDEVPEERELGMEAGFAWGLCADATVVYWDYGISAGMRKGIKRAKREGRPVEYRKLYS